MYNRLEKGILEKKMKTCVVAAWACSSAPRYLGGFRPGPERNRSCFSVGSDISALFQTRF